MIGVCGLFIAFDAIVGVVCCPYCMLVFKEKLCFKLMGCDIFVIDKYNCE